MIILQVEFTCNSFKGHSKTERCQRETTPLPLVEGSQCHWWTAIHFCLQSCKDTIGRYENEGRKRIFFKEVKEGRAGKKWHGIRVKIDGEWKPEWNIKEISKERKECKREGERKKERCVRRHARRKEDRRSVRRKREKCSEGEVRKKREKIRGVLGGLEGNHNKKK